MTLLLQVAHAITNIFAGGRSTAKIFLFLAYLIALGLALVVARVRMQMNKPRQSPKLLVGLIAGALLLNLFSFVYFARAYHLPLRSTSIMVSHQEISSSRLWHTHVLKGGIGLALNALHHGQQENVDTGLAYVGTVPACLFIIADILVLAILTCGIWCFYLGVNGFEKRKQWLYLFAYAIASFSLMKNVLDGGLFNHETLVSLAFLVVLLFSFSLRARKWALGLIAAYLAAIAVLYATHSLAAFGELIHELLSAFTLGILLTALVYGLASKKYDRLGVLIAIFAVIVCGYAIFTDLSIYEYRNLRMSHTDPGIIGLYHSVDDPHYKLVGSMGGFYEYTFTPEQPTKLSTLLSEHHLLDNFFPISIPWQTCFPKAPPATYSYTLITLDGPLRDTELKNELIHFRAAPMKVANDTRPHYHVEADIDGCLPRHLNILQEATQTLGAQSFIVTSLSIGEE